MYTLMIENLRNEY